MDRILLVQDSPSVNMMLKFRLEAGGFSVDIAETGEEGLEKAKNNRYQLILLDYTLPGINGAEVCRALRREDALKTVPVLFMSAKKEDELAELTQGCGADGYADVFFEGSDFIGRLKDMIKNHKHRE